MARRLGSGLSRLRPRSAHIPRGPNHSLTAFDQAKSKESAYFPLLSSVGSEQPHANGNLDALFLIERHDSPFRSPNDEGVRKFPESERIAFMIRLLIGAIMIGATANPLAAQAVVTLPALVMASPHQWGLPYSSAAPRNGGVPDWAYRSPCEVTPELCSHGASGFPDWGYASDPAFYPDTPRGLYPLMPSAITPIPVNQQAGAPAPPAPSVARSEIREYQWPSPAAIRARQPSLSSLRMARSNRPLRCGFKAAYSTIARPPSARAECQSILSTVRQHASSMRRNTLTSGWPEIRRA